MEFQANESLPPTNMIWICKAEVPSYLQVGEFYRSLDGDDLNESISVPADILKESVVINNVNDLADLLKSLRYWMVGELPSEILQYVLFTHSAAAVLQCISDYEQDFPYLTTLRTLVEESFTNKDSRVSVLDRALQLGDIRIVQLLRDRGDEFSPDSVLCAAAGGNVDCLKCAQDNHENVSQEAFRLCITKGHLDCLEYLQSITQKVDFQQFYACTLAAGARQLPCLKFLHEQGYSLHYTTASAAVANNDLEMLEYLHLHGYHCMFQGCARIAALKGYNECLLFMHEHGYPFNVDKCAWAAEGGHLHCLKFLREHGCPWDFRTCDAAIRQGHLDCLQYAHENGCVSGYAEEILADKDVILSAEMRAYVEQMLCEYAELDS